MHTCVDMCLNDLVYSHAIVSVCEVMTIAVSDDRMHQGNETSNYHMFIRIHQVGFINPFLYSVYDSAPSVFTDITVGDNRCGAYDASGTYPLCCPSGYYSEPGWVSMRQQRAETRKEVREKKKERKKERKSDRQRDKQREREIFEVVLRGL